MRPGRVSLRLGAGRQPRHNNEQSGGLNDGERLERPRGIAREHFERVGVQRSRLGVRFRARCARLGGGTSGISVQNRHGLAADRERHRDAAPPGRQLREPGSGWTSLEAADTDRHGIDCLGDHAGIVTGDLDCICAVERVAKPDEAPTVKAIAPDKQHAGATPESSARHERIQHFAQRSGASNRPDAFDQSRRRRFGFPSDDAEPRGGELVADGVYLATHLRPDES